MDPAVGIEVLGPLTALVGKRSVALGPPLQRTVLAALVVDLGRTIPTADLIERVWAGRPPASAGKNLQKYLSRLRRILGPAVIATERGGYRLTLEPSAIDSYRFEATLARASTLDDPVMRCEELTSALALVRGDGFAGIDSPFAVAERVRLRELQAAADDELTACHLGLGELDAALARASAAAAAAPLRDRAWGHLLVALHRSGRRADALDACRDLRRRLTEETGAGPGPALRRIEHRILVDAPDPGTSPADRVRGGRPGPAGDPGRPGDPPLLPEPRRLHLVVVAPEPPGVGGGPTDDERRAIVAAVAGRHDGRLLERDDHLLVMFGLPPCDDDAIRQADAAADLTSAGLRPTTTSGEAVVTGRDGTVDLAGLLLEQAPDLPVTDGSPPAPAVRSEPALPPATGRAADPHTEAPLLLPPTGRATATAAIPPTGTPPAGQTAGTAAIPARPGPGAPRRRRGVVGRGREVEQLVDLWRRCLSTRSAGLAVAVGDPGIGTSTLLREATDRIVASGAAMVGTDCRRVGDGSAGPVVRLLAAAFGPDPVPALRTSAERAGMESREVDRLVDGVSPLFGGGGTGRDRREHLDAWSRALGLALPAGGLIVIDDAHHAGALLDVTLAGLLRGGGPLLVLAAGRPGPDPLPEVAAAAAPTTVLRPGPLDEVASRALAARLLGPGAEPDLVSTVVDRAAGNPFLICESALAAADHGRAEEVPATIGEAVADRLEASGRVGGLVLQVAAVAAEPVPADLVAQILRLPIGPVRQAFTELRRRRLMTPDRDDPARQAISHQLVGDAARRLVPPERAARIHDRTADWLLRTRGTRDLDVLERIVAHQAGRRGQAMAGRGDAGATADGVTLAGLAGRLLDVDAARSRDLHREALDLLDPSGSEWAEAALGAGRLATDHGHWHEAEALLDGAAASCRRRGDRRAEAAARTVLGRGRHLRGAPGAAEETERAIALVRNLPGPELATALTHRMAMLPLAGGEELALRIIARDRAVVDAHGDIGDRVRMGGARAAARLGLGDHGGLDDLRHTLDLCLAHGLSHQATMAYADLGEALSQHVGPGAAIPVLVAGRDHAAAHHQRHGDRSLSGTLARALYDGGRWDEAARLAAALIEGDDPLSGTGTQVSGLIGLWRGDGAARALGDDLLDTARADGGLRHAAPWLTAVAMGRAAGGDPGAALDAIGELVALTGGRDRWRSVPVNDAVRVALACGDVDLAASLPPLRSLSTKRAELSRLTALVEVGARTDPAGTLPLATRLRRHWRRFGHPLEAALATMATARCLDGTGRRDEAARRRERAWNELAGLGIGPGGAWIDLVTGPGPAAP